MEKIGTIVTMIRFDIKFYFKTHKNQFQDGRRRVEFELMVEITINAIREHNDKTI